jgi:hypothetical protein
MACQKNAINLDRQESTSKMRPENDIVVPKYGTIEMVWLKKCIVPLYQKMIPLYQKHMMNEEWKRASMKIKRGLFVNR